MYIYLGIYICGLVSACDGTLSLARIGTGARDSMGSDMRAALRQLNFECRGETDEGEYNDYTCDIHIRTSLTSWLSRRRCFDTAPSLTYMYITFISLGWIVSSDFFKTIRLLFCSDFLNTYMFNNIIFVFVLFRYSSLSNGVSSNHAKTCLLLI